MQTKKVTYGIIIALCLVGALFLLTRLVNKKFTSPTSAPVSVDTKGTDSPFDENFSPDGKIYLGLFPLSEKETENIKIYSYDLQAEKIEKLWNGEKGVNYIMNKFSPDGEVMAFSALSSDENNQTYKKTAQVYISNKNGENPIILSGESDFNNLFPVWSPDQKAVAFWTTKNKIERKGDTPDFANQQVKVVDLSGKTVFEVDGTSPQFLPDGRLMVIKKDGLYAYDISKKNEGELFWKMKEGAEANVFMRCIVSKDGDKIVWSDPIFKKIYITEISIKSKEEIEKIKHFFSMEKKNIGKINSIKMDKVEIVDAAGLSPMFSPDGKYLAWLDIDSQKKSGLFLYNLETKEKKNVLDLSQYEIFHMTDWTE